MLTKKQTQLVQRAAKNPDDGGTAWRDRMDAWMLENQQKELWQEIALAYAISFRIAP